MNTIVLSQNAAHEAIEHAKSAPTEMLCIGIDIAKQTHVARAVLGTNKRLKKGCSFDTTIDGFKKFIKWLNLSKVENNIKYTFISMEPTATYWRPVFNYLKNALPDCEVFQVDPLAVAYARKMHSSNLSKGDPEDAFLIAELTQNGKCRRTLQRTQLSMTLREFYRNNNHAVKQAIICERQLRLLLDTLMPGVLKIIPERCQPDIYAVFNKFLDPDKIRSYSLNEWIRINSEFKCPVTKLKKIHALAKNNIKAFDDCLFCKTVWKQVWQAYKSAHSQNETFKKLIADAASKHEAYKNMLTIPGFGPMTIGGFIAGAGNIFQFKKPEQIEKAFGFDLQRTQSGKSEKTPHITKRGYNFARAAMYMAAFAGCDLPAWKDYYQRKKANSGSGKKALIALAAKMTRTAWKIAVENVPFDYSKVASDKCE